MSDLKRHFHPEIQAEKISFFHPELQGFRAFEPDRRAQLAERYAKKFPRCPVDWHFEKMKFRPGKTLPSSFSDYSKALGRQRSGDKLPEAKSKDKLTR